MKTENTDIRLPCSTPEAQGIPAAAIMSFVDDAEEHIHDLHSLMILRHGHVVAEGWWSPYAPDIPHMLYSLSKSFTSSAIGLAVEEGLLTIDDAVLSFFPDEAPEDVSENLSAMQVRHLLSMNTGHDADLLQHLRDSNDPNWTKTFLTIPVTHAPGTHFVYNSGASYLLSDIVQKLTGMTLLDYLQPRLFQPLGIQNPEWQTCPRGINTGGWGLSITTEDIACFGQMVLQKGLWNGQRILTESWIANATAYHSDNSASSDEVDWRQGYGFQFWLCQHNAYRGDGAFGQFCVVMPEQDAVFVTTAGVEDMQSILDLVWKHLLPAMEPERLSENRLEAEQLGARLDSLKLSPEEGDTASPVESIIAKKEYRFKTNELGIQSLSFNFQDDDCLIHLRDERGEHEVRCGRGDWRMESSDLLISDNNLITSNRVAASASWTTENTFVAKLCFYETPHILKLTCRFDEDRVYYDSQVNVSFEETAPPQLEGRMA